MPALNNEQLDDPLLFDAMPDFSQGQRSNSPAGNLEQMQYFFGLNLDIKTKLAVTRRGTSDLGQPANTRFQGLQWYDIPPNGASPAIEYLVAVIGGRLWRYDETGWTQFSSYTATGGADVQIGMAQLINKLYIADGQSDLFSWDGSTLVDLGFGSSTQPPRGNLILTHNNRLWIAGLSDVPDALYASTPLAIGGGAAGAWDSANLSIRIGAGEGDPIIGLAPWDAFQIIVFKRNSVYIVQADPAQTQTSLATAGVTKITDTIGCVAPRSIAVVGSDVWFLSDSGVRSVRRVIAQTQREVSNAISEPIHDLIQRINWSAASTAASAFWDNKYLLSVPLDAATEPDSVLVFDTLRQAWAGIWSGWSPTVFALSKAGGDERLNIGQSDGSALRWLDYVTANNESADTYQDAGATIPTEIRTRGLIFGDGFADKAGFNVETVFYQSTAQADLQLAFDQGQDEPLASGVDSSGGVPLLLPFALPAIVNAVQIKRRTFPTRHFNSFREMQVVVRSSQDKLALRAITAAAFEDSVSPQA